MDNDDLRRGKPSLHKAFGEATALLTGDFFLTWSFELLSKAKDFNAEEKIEKLIQILSKAAGGEGMVGGQLLELNDPKPEELAAIYRGKTGRLIEAAVEFGRIIAGVSADERLEIYGKNLGIAFQLQDDLDDYDTDITNGKVTLATHHGKEQTKSHPIIIYLFKLGIGL